MRICSVDGCGKEFYSKDCCRKHYNQILKYGEIQKDTNTIRLCSVDGCNKKHVGLGYCIKHWKQFKTYGKILERTTRDKNEITIQENICWMKLYDNKSQEIADTTFDLEFKYIIEKYKWHLTDGEYVACTYLDEKNKFKLVKLHQAIVSLLGEEVPDDCEIDHKDGNKLNNLKNNLRICKHLGNTQNRKMQNNNSSGYFGVTFDKGSGKWRAQIMVNYNPIYLGLFNTKEEAARAYNVAAIKYHEEFAKLNDI